MNATEWAFDSCKEAFEQVAQDEARMLSIVQEIMNRSTDYLRRIIAPVRGQGGVTMSNLCPHCNSFPLEDNIWWVSTGHQDSNNRKKKHCNWWCIRVEEEAEEIRFVPSATSVPQKPLFRCDKRCSAKRHSVSGSWRRW